MFVNRWLVISCVFVGLLFAGDAYCQTIPDSVQKALGHLVGSWENETKLGDKVVQGEYVAEWSPNKDSVIWHWKGTTILIDKPVTASGILGWDGQKNSMVEHGFTSLGEVFSASYKLSKDTWESPTVGTWLIDGKYLTDKCLRIFKWNSDDEWIVTGTQRIMDGKPQPDIVDTFRRIK